MSAIAADALVRDRLFIGGEWVEPAGSGTIDVVNPATEEVIGRVPEGTPEDADRAVRAARAAFDSWSETSPYERAQLAGAIGAKLAERGRRARRADRHRARHAAHAVAHDPGGAAVGDVLVPARSRRGDRLGGGGGQLADRARAGGRRGRDHPLELSAQPDREQGGPGAHRGLHRGAQAQRGRAAVHVRARRDLRRGRAAARASSTSSPATARWWARRSSRTPRPTWCRSPAPRAPGGACRSWPRRRSSRCRSSWAASRPTSSSTTPTSSRRSPTAWPSATSTPGRPAAP